MERKLIINPNVPDNEVWVNGKTWSHPFGLKDESVVICSLVPCRYCINDNTAKSSNCGDCNNYDLFDGRRLISK